MFTGPSDPSHHAHLIDQAKAEAACLRSEAIQQFGDEALGDFWRGANAVWLRMQAGHALAQRSAARLRARLTRREAIRQSGSRALQTGA